MPEVGCLSDGYHAVGSRRVYRADDRAEVPRIADLVQRDEHRVLPDREVAKPDRGRTRDDRKTNGVLALREGCEGIPCHLDDLGPRLGAANEIKCSLARKQGGAVEDDLDVRVFQGLPRGRDALDQEDTLSVPMLALAEFTSPLQEWIGRARDGFWTHHLRVGGELGEELSAASRLGIFADLRRGESQPAQ